MSRLLFGGRISLTTTGTFMSHPRVWALGFAYPWGEIDNMCVERNRSIRCSLFVDSDPCGRCFGPVLMSLRYRLCCCRVRQRQQDPKFRKLSTSSKVYQDVLSTHPPMLEVLRLAGFRQQEGDEGHLALLHRYSTSKGSRGNSALHVQWMLAGRSVLSYR